MPKITGIKAITFDADGTLWDFERVMRNSLGYALKELEKFDSAAASKLNIDKMIEIRNRVADESKNRLKTHEEVRLEAFKRTLAEVGRTDDFLASRLNQVFFEHRFADIELFEDVLPALEILRKRYRIGLVSNGNSYPDKCGLEGIFHFEVFSQNYGFDKPDPRLFYVTGEKAGCSVTEMLIVGDSLKNDIAGAAAVGMKAVWLNRKEAKPDPSIKVDYEIKSLTELLDIL